jgi:uncharacterized membrane protein YgdD (TMEM256/DUF423 family)
MSTWLKIWLTLAGLSGLLAVALGAYGSHGLKGVEVVLANRFDTAVQYHFFHTLALLAVVVLAISMDSLGLRLARWAFLLGIVLFCGSLYASVFSNGAWSTRMAPAGGIMLMLGWLALMVHAWLPTSD